MTMTLAVIEAHSDLTARRGRCRSLQAGVIIHARNAGAIEARLPSFHKQPTTANVWHRNAVSFIINAFWQRKLITAIVKII